MPTVFRPCFRASLAISTGTAFTPELETITKVSLGLKRYLLKIISASPLMRSRALLATGPSWSMSCGSDIGSTGTSPPAR